MNSKKLCRYIIIGPARSGTTVTHLCLAGHPNVSALGDEVKVHPFFTNGISTFTHGNDLETERRAGFLALFDSLCTINSPQKLLACGLKTAISNTAEAVTLVKSIKENFPKMKIVLTLREDIVAQFGSLEHAKATGKWHSWIKPERELKENLQFKKKQLRDHSIDHLKTVSELQRLKKNHEVFEVSYEKDILPGDLKVYYRLFHFLGLPEIEINWLRSKKVAPTPEKFIDDYARYVASVKKLRLRFETTSALFKVAPEIATGRIGILQRVRRKLFISGLRNL